MSAVGLTSSRSETAAARDEERRSTELHQEGHPTRDGGDGGQGGHHLLLYSSQSPFRHEGSLWRGDSGQTNEVAPRQRVPLRSVLCVREHPLPKSLRLHRLGPGTVDESASADGTGSRNYDSQNSVLLDFFRPPPSSPSSTALSSPTAMMAPPASATVYDVFESCVHPLITSGVDGYDVALIAPVCECSAPSTPMNDGLRTGGGSSTSSSGSFRRSFLFDVDPATGNSFGMAAAAATTEDLECSGSGAEGPTMARECTPFSRSPSTSSSSLAADGKRFLSPAVTGRSGSRPGGGGGGVTPPTGAILAAVSQQGDTGSGGLHRQMQPAGSEEPSGLISIAMGYVFEYLANTISNGDIVLSLSVFQLADDSGFIIDALSGARVVKPTVIGSLAVGGEDGRRRGENASAEDSANSNNSNIKHERRTPTTASAFPQYENVRSEILTDFDDYFKAVESMVLADGYPTIVQLTLTRSRSVVLASPGGAAARSGAAGKTSTATTTTDKKSPTANQHNASRADNENDSNDVDDAVERSPSPKLGGHGGGVLPSAAVNNNSSTANGRRPTGSKSIIKDFRDGLEDTPPSAPVAAEAQQQPQPQVEQQEQEHFVRVSNRMIFVETPSQQEALSQFSERHQNQKGRTSNGGNEEAPGLLDQWLESAICGNCIPSLVLAAESTTTCSSSDLPVVVSSSVQKAANTCEDLVESLRLLASRTSSITTTAIDGDDDGGPFHPNGTEWRGGSFLLKEVSLPDTNELLLIKRLQSQLVHVESMGIAALGTFVDLFPGPALLVAPQYNMVVSGNKGAKEVLLRPAAKAEAVAAEDDQQLSSCFTELFPLVPMATLVNAGRSCSISGRDLVTTISSSRSNGDGGSGDDDTCTEELVGGPGSVSVTLHVSELTNSILLVELAKHTVTTHTDSPHPVGGETSLHVLMLDASKALSEENMVPSPSASPSSAAASLGSPPCLAGAPSAADASAAECRLHRTQTQPYGSELTTGIVEEGNSSHDASCSIHHPHSRIHGTKVLTTAGPSQTGDQSQQLVCSCARTPGSGSGSGGTPPNFFKHVETSESDAESLSSPSAPGGGGGLGLRGRPHIAPTITLDPKGNVKSCNLAAYKALNLPQAVSFVGKDLSMLSYHIDGGGRSSPDDGQGDDHPDSRLHRYQQEHGLKIQRPVTPEAARKKAVVIAAVDSRGGKANPISKGGRGGLAPAGGDRQKGAGINKTQQETECACVVC